MRLALERPLGQLAVALVAGCYPFDRRARGGGQLEQPCGQRAADLIENGNALPQRGVQKINARVDQRISGNNMLFARYSYWKAESLAYDAWGLGTQGQGPTGVTTHQAVIGDTHTFNGTTTLDMRLSFLGVFQHELPLSSGVDLSQLGSNWSRIPTQFPNPANWPQLAFNGSPGVSSITGSNGIGSQLYWHQNITTASANVTKIIGSHLLKMGGMVRTVQWISDPANGPVTLTFDPIATSQASGVGGSGVASALLGLPLSTATNYIGGSQVNLTPFGFFVDDTYQAGKRLTLTMGLRWDQPSDFSEVNGNDTVFLSNHDNPRVVSAFGNDSPAYRVASAKALATMLLTLKGTPFIYQGDELGMTNYPFTGIDQFDDIAVKNAWQTFVVSKQVSADYFLSEMRKTSRDNSRTPMQWDSSANAGFTTASKPWLAVNPNYLEINAKQELSDKGSIYHYFRKMTDVRRNAPAFVYGDYKDVDPGNPQVFAYTRSVGNDRYPVSGHRGN
jgi:hypothetical protein